MWLVSWLTTRALRLNQRQTSGFILSTIFNNAGNYGLPVLLFAFGQAGLERGLLYFVASSFLTNTLGVFIASRGRAGVRASLRAVAGVPVFYAVLLALAFNLAHIALPEPLLKPIKLLADASVPTLELVLGMQLARTTLQRDLRSVCVASFVALVVSAGMAFLLAAVWGLQGLSRQVCIVETAMPTAVMTTVLATEFDAEPGFVTSTVLLTTLGSVVTVTLLLGILM
jgi:predicted permease